MLRKLMSAYGVAGLEDSVRQILTEALGRNNIHCYTDKMGNLHAVKEGEGKRFFLASYMDEPGIIITKITEDGYLKFETVGRISPAFLVSKRVVVEGHYGIISLKAIHLAKKSEREIPVRTEQLYIDIGAKNQADAAQYIQIGDYGVIDSPYRIMRNDFVKGRAPAGRMGCFAILEILKKTTVPIHAVFAVQREIGCRGMMAAAWNVTADVSVILDGVEDPTPKPCENMAKSGEGVVLVRRTENGNADTRLWNDAMDIAKKHGIAIQCLHQSPKGQEGVLMQSGKGHRCLCLAIPVRYFRSAAQIANLQDMQSMIALIERLMNEI